MYLFITFNKTLKYINTIQSQLIGSLSVEPFTLDFGALQIAMTMCDVG